VVFGVGLVGFFVVFVGFGLGGVGLVGGESYALVCGGVVRALAPPR